MKPTRTVEMVTVVTLMLMSAPVMHAFQVDVPSQWFRISGIYIPGDGSPSIP